MWLSVVLCLNIFLNFLVTDVIYDDFVRLRSKMNKEEFNISVVSLKDKIFRFAKRILVCAEDAEDVTQDILIKLWRMKDNLDRINSVEALAIRSTKNLCLDRLRREKTKRRKMEVMKTETETETVCRERSDVGEMKEMVRGIVNNLPEKQRMVMHLRDIEGYDVSQIADVTGMDANAVRVNLSRARKIVRDEISKVLRYGL